MYVCTIRENYREEQFIKQLEERDARESRLRPSVVRRSSQMLSCETLIITTAFTAIICFSYTIYITQALHMLENMFLKLSTH